MTANDFADAVSEASEGKITGKYDQENGRFFFNSSETGSENNFTLTAEGDAANQALDKLGLVEDSAIYTTSSVKGKVQSATDAVIELNGAEITSSTNTVNV
jgi:flagellar capping protein FliD